MKVALVGTISPKNFNEKFLLPESSAFGSVSLDALHTNGRMSQAGIIAMKHCHLYVGLLRPLNKEAKKRVTGIDCTTEIVLREQKLYLKPIEYTGEPLYTFLPIVLLDENLLYK